MVKINDRYCIDATNTCYVLKEKYVVSDESSKNYGEIIYKDLGYYNSIANLLNAVLKMEIRKFIAQDTEHTLKELIQQVKSYEDYIKSLNLNV